MRSFHKNQDQLSPGLFEANFDPLVEASGINLKYNYGPNMVFDHMMSQNLGHFAARKTLAQQAALTRALFDQDGKLRPFVEFEKEAKPVLKDYNRNWLAAEYNTTTRSARMATDWRTAQEEKDLFPNIKYLPSRSATPREAHKPYYHIIRPVDDPFWDTHLPPNGWQCLCGFKTTDEEVTDIPEDLEPPEFGFRQNVGKTAKPFDNSHPYFSQRYPERRKLMAEMMESMPYNIDVDGVKVSLWADPSDLESNLQAAQIFKESFDDVRIMPHHFDGRKNPEYLIDQVQGDLVVAQGSTIKGSLNNALRRKYQQMSGKFYLVFNVNALALPGEEILAREIYGSLKQRRRCNKLIMVMDESLYVVVDQGMNLEEIQEAIKTARGN
jgi:hypothetical protein